MIQLKTNHISALKVMASVIGTICGISGIEHGFFEMIQGSIVPEIHLVNGRPFIYAIGEANRFWKYGFEWAYTVIPNFLITGIVTMIISLCVIIWAGWFIQRKYGCLVFILLSIIQYLTGGGAAQIGLAVIIGASAALIGRPLKWLRTILPEGTRQVLAKPWILLLVLFSFLFCQTMITAITGFFYGLNDPELIQNIQWIMLYMIIGIFPLMFLSVLAHESQYNDFA